MKTHDALILATECLHDLANSAEIANSSMEKIGDVFKKLNQLWRSDAICNRRICSHIINSVSCTSFLLRPWWKR